MDPVPAVLYAVSPLTGIDKAWQSLLRLTPFRFNQKYGGFGNLPPLVLLSVRPLCASLSGQDRVGARRSLGPPPGQPRADRDASAHARGAIPSPLRKMSREFESNRSGSAFILDTLELCVRCSLKTWKGRFTGNDRYRPTGPSGSGSSALTSTILSTALGGDPASWNHGFSAGLGDVSREGKSRKAELTRKTGRSGSGAAWLPGPGVWVLFPWHLAATDDFESAVSSVTIC